MWLSFYDFMQDGLGIDCGALNGLLGLATCCGWWAPYKNMAILQHRHCELHLDDLGRLHHNSRAACLYRDGFGVYAWHGIRVPEWIITNPKSITPELITNEGNAEIKRVMLERYGVGTYLYQTGAEIVHQDNFGVLYRQWINDEEFMAVRVWNGTVEPDGTTREFFLQVHPQLRPMFPDGSLGEPQELTARAAVASTYGYYADEYDPQERT
jgi:hypothetical protein